MDIQTDFYCHTAIGNWKKEYPKITASVGKIKKMSQKNIGSILNTLPIIFYLFVHWFFFEGIVIFVSKIYKLYVRLLCSADHLRLLGIIHSSK